MFPSRRTTATTSKRQSTPSIPRASRYAEAAIPSRLCFLRSTLSSGSPNRVEAPDFTSTNTRVAPSRVTRSISPRHARMFLSTIRWPLFSRYRAASSSALPPLDRVSNPPKVTHPANPGYGNCCCAARRFHAAGSPTRATAFHNPCAWRSRTGGTEGRNRS